MSAEYARHLYQSTKSVYDPEWGFAPAEVQHQFERVAALVRTDRVNLARRLNVALAHVLGQGGMSEIKAVADELEGKTR